MDNAFTEPGFHAHDLLSSRTPADGAAAGSRALAPAADEYEHAVFMGSALEPLSMELPTFEHHSMEADGSDPFSKPGMSIPLARADKSLLNSHVLGVKHPFDDDLEAHQTNPGRADSSVKGPPGVVCPERPPRGREAPPPLPDYIEPLTSFVISGESMWATFLSVISALAQVGAEIDPVEGWSVRARAFDGARSAPFLVNMFTAFPTSEKPGTTTSTTESHSHPALMCVEFQRLSGDSNAFLRLLGNTLAKLDTVLMAPLSGAHSEAVQTASAHLIPAHELHRPQVIGTPTVFGSSESVAPRLGAPCVLTVPQELSRLLALPDLVGSREAAEAIATLTCHWIGIFHAASSVPDAQDVLKSEASRSEPRRLRVSDELIDLLADALRSSDYDTQRSALIALSNLALCGVDEREQVARNFAAVSGMVDLLSGASSSWSLQRETLRGLAAVSASEEVAVGPIARFVRPYCAAQDEASRDHANAFLRNASPRLIC